MGWSGWKGTLKIIEIPTPCHGQEHLPLPQTAPSPGPRTLPGMGQPLLQANTDRYQEQEERFGGIYKKNSKDETGTRIISMQGMSCECVTAEEEPTQGLRATQNTCDKGGRCAQQL